MRSPNRLVAAALVLAAATDVRAQPPDVRAGVEGVPPRLALSESMRLTLTLEGPKPLRVALPEKLLTADANAAWRVRPDGPAAVSPAGTGRERWQQTYRFAPWDAGDSLVLRFNPATVNGQPVTWPAVTVTVTTSVTDPAATAPHGPVGVEDPPPPPIEPPPSPAPLVALGAASAVVLASLVVLTRKRRARPVPPRDAALAALSELLATASPAAERVAAVLRAFVEDTFGVPATTLTTAELLAATREQGWPAERAEALGEILDTCDRAKFAGDVLDADDARQLVRLAIDWVEASQSPAPA